MIIHDVVQGTTEWLAVRAGIPTASCFDRIITKSGKPSSQAEKYMHRLLAERIMGHPVAEFTSAYMERGSALEAEAVAYYEGIREVETVKVGFITNDERTIGASPDRLSGENGLLEIKCPAEHTHVGYLITHAVDHEYYPQIQGQLWVTGRQWVDIQSYHPEMPPALIRVGRDEDFIAKLAAAVSAFSRELERLTVEARERNWIEAPSC